MKILSILYDFLWRTRKRLLVAHCDAHCDAHCAYITQASRLAAEGLDS
jgi:hypothetical protein